MQNTTERKDVYSRITAQIVDHLEKGVRPWISRGTPSTPPDGSPGRCATTASPTPASIFCCSGCPPWPEFRRPDLDDLQAGQRTERPRPQGREWLACRLCQHHHPHRDDDKTGEDIEREIPFMKGYTVFNVEQIDGLPAIYYAKPRRTSTPSQRIEHAEPFFASTGRDHPARRQPGLLRARNSTTCRCRPSKPSATPRAITRRSPMN